MNPFKWLVEDLVGFAGSCELCGSEFMLHGKGATLKSNSPEVVSFCEDCLFPFLQHDGSKMAQWKVYALTDYPISNLEGGIIRNFPLWQVQIVSVPRERTAFVVGDESDVGITTMKLLRQIVFFQLEVALPNFVLLHASAISKAGKVIAFISPGGDIASEVCSGARGKSLAQASCLFLGEFDFVTDDLLPVWISEKGVRVCGYPDYLDLKLSIMGSLFPGIPLTRGIRKEDFGEAHMYLTPGDLKEAYGIDTFTEDSSPLQSVFLVNLKKEHPEGLQSLPIGDRTVLERMVTESLRLDHLFSETYNPNWLGFPRKPSEDFRRDARAVAAALTGQRIEGRLLQGRIDNPQQILEAVLAAL